MAKVGILKNLAKGLLLQEGTTAVLRIPVVGEILQQGVSMVSQVVRSLGGESLETEIVNALPERQRSITEAALRRVRRGRAEIAEGDDMAGKKPGGNFVEKGQTVIGKLDDARRNKLDGWIDQHAHGVGDLILEKIGKVYGDLRTLSSKVTDLMVKEERGMKIDLINEFRISFSDVKKAQQPGEAMDGVKAGELLGKLSDKVMKKIIEVTSDIANDSDEDQANFNRKMANLFRDGSEAAIKSAKKILGHVAKLNIKKRRTWFNVRPNRLTQIKAGLKKVFTKPKVKPVSDEDVKAAKASADQVWERIRSRRAARATH
ncbi:hypothetical protein IID19_02020 [Patescibacteria group bacterium]|nr:hypothetical protein [Patescibacteria group bacterium]